jgi:hypothetical protein
VGAFRRFALLRRVVVNLKDGSAIEGVFWRQAGPLIVLSKAVLHEPGMDPQPLDGETIIERAEVRFIQAP